MRIVTFVCVLCGAASAVWAVSEGVTSGAATPPQLPAVKKAGPRKVVLEKDIIKQSKNQEDRYEGEGGDLRDMSTETLMNNIYTKGRERTRMKSVLAAYLMGHLALTAIRSYTVVSPQLNVIFTSLHALMEKLLPNIEQKWVERQSELQGLVWDYLDRHSITEAPARVRVYHGMNHVTIPILKKSRNEELPEDFQDIGKSSYAMYKNIVF